MLVQALRAAGIDVGGIADLTTSACARFNQEVRDCPEVQYFSIAGVFKPALFPPSLLQLPYQVVRDAEGDSDGVVSVQSATFGESRENWKFLGTWPANHFRLINWGANIIPTMDEQSDDSIVQRYLELAARVSQIERQST
jgi:triacylglycerol lipase